MDEGPHALGDVGLVEERPPVALFRDDLVQLLDLVADPDLEGIGLQDACVTDGFHGGTPIC